MAIYTKGEDLIGYKVTVWSSTGKTTSYRGYSEGSSVLSDRAKATLIKAGPTTALKAAVGGGLGVSASIFAAGALGGAVGETISAIIMRGIDEALINRATLAMSQDSSTSLGVTIAGDFAAQFKIETPEDVRQLPKLLAVIPATFQEDGKPYWMGKSIIETLAREQLGTLAGGGQTDVRYTIDV